MGPLNLTASVSIYYYLVFFIVSFIAVACTVMAEIRVYKRYTIDNTSTDQCCLIIMQVVIVVLIFSFV